MRFERYSALLLASLIALSNVRAEPLPLETKSLTSSHWYFAEGDYRKTQIGAEVEFLPDSRISTTQSFTEELPIIRGSYGISNGFLALQYQIFSGHTLGTDYAENLPWNSAKCTLKDDPKPFLYRNYFVCDNGYHFYRISDRPNPGDIIFAGDIQVDATERVTAKTVKNARLRTGPGTKYPRIHYQVDLCGKEFPYVPANYSVRIYARTKTKETIGKWTDYWYYVNASDQCNPGYHWIFGALLNLKQ